MHIRDAQSIRQLALGHFHNPELVRAIAQQIALIEGAHNRREALSALVDQLLAAGELDVAASAARLAPELTPSTYVNNVDYWLQSSLLLEIVDRLLERQDLVRAAQLLDEAALGLEELARYEPFDLPAELPWFQLTRRYECVDLPGRIHRVWDTVIAWARSIERSMAIPERYCFQPEDGSSFLL
ncbi:MAG TPA: hypothetical protein VFO07_17340, partial [Roseiflexaceae bacterium]|nr:hypothetical protein [Roseiflexaceae bacterium]